MSGDIFLGRRGGGGASSRKTVLSIWLPWNCMMVHPGPSRPFLFPLKTAIMTSWKKITINS